MADWYGKARSNYFKVKNTEKFRKEAGGLGLEVHENIGKPGWVALFPSENSEYGGWPYEIPSQDENEEKDADTINYADFFKRHLSKDQVAILMEIGAEKLRYMTGNAIAYDWRGKETSVDLDDIYEKAAETFGVPLAKITTAEY